MYVLLCVVKEVIMITEQNELHSLKYIQLYSYMLI